MDRLQEIVARTHDMIAKSQALRDRQRANRQMIQTLTDPASLPRGQLHFVFEDTQPTAH